MAVEDRIAVVQALLDGIKRYARLVQGNSFTEDTLSELKGNAKDVCNEAKSEIDSTKTDIDNWS